MRLRGCTANHLMFLIANITQARWLTIIFLVNKTRPTVSEPKAFLRSEGNDVAVHNRSQIHRDVVHVSSDRGCPDQRLGVDQPQTGDQVGGVVDSLVTVDEFRYRDGRAKLEIRRSKRTGRGTADGDGIPEESGRLRRDDRMTGQRSAGRLTEDGDLVRVAGEHCNVLLDPGQRRLNVPQAVVTGGCFVALMLSNMVEN